MIVLYCVVLCCVVLCCAVLYCVVLCCVVLYCIVLTVCFVCLFIQDEISRAYLKILQASGKAKEFLASIVMAEVSTLGKPCIQNDVAFCYTHISYQALFFVAPWK